MYFEEFINAVRVLYIYLEDFFYKHVVGVFTHTLRNSFETVGALYIP